MKWIKRILITIVILVIGGAAGAIGASIAWHKLMSSFASTALVEVAVDARHLQSERVNEVLNRKTEAIPSLVQQLHSVHRRYLTEAQYNSALWAARRFYADPQMEIPSSIRSILDALPPQPPIACELGPQTQQGNHEGVEQTPGSDSERRADVP